MRLRFRNPALPARTGLQSLQSTGIPSWEEGKIPESRIDESVGRILALKEKYRGSDEHKWISDWRSHAPFRWRAAFKSVTLLKNRIIEMGDIPFYGTAAANVQSQNIAFNSGFRPAWVETEAVKMGEEA